MDSGCARPTNSDRRECSCLSIGGSAKATVFSSAPKLHENNKKKKAREKPKIRTRNAAKLPNGLSCGTEYNVLNNEIKIGAVSFSLVNHCGHIGRETVLVNDHGRPQNTSARVYRYKLSAECVRITPKVGKINHGIYYV